MTHPGSLLGGSRAVIIRDHPGACHDVRGDHFRHLHRTPAAVAHSPILAAHRRVWLTGDRAPSGADGAAMGYADGGARPIAWRTTSLTAARLVSALKPHISSAT